MEYVLWDVAVLIGWLLFGYFWCVCLLMMKTMSIRNARMTSPHHVGISWSVGPRAAFAASNLWSH